MPDSLASSKHYLKVENAQLKAAYNQVRSKMARIWLQSKGFDPDGDLRIPIESKRNPKFQSTAMYEACALGEPEVCEYLVEAGFADTARTPNSNGGTPMGVACYSGNLHLAKWLFDAGAAEDIRTPDNDGETPIIWACDGGHLHVAKWLFEVGAAEDIRTRDNKGISPLMRTCIGEWRGHQVANWLYEVGAEEDIRAPSSTGCTPLSYAVAKRMVALIQWLLKHGAVSDDEGHVDPFVLQQSIPDFTLRDSLRSSFSFFLSQHACFSGLVLPAISIQRRDSTNRSPLRLLHGHEGALLPTIADFAGIVYGRLLRNAREANRALRNMKRFEPPQRSMSGPQPPGDL
jgi:hypothetical protein